MTRRRPVLLTAALLLSALAARSSLFDGAALVAPSAASKQPVASVPLLALPAPPVRTGFAFSYKGVRVSLGFAYDPSTRAGIVTFEPHDGSASASVPIQGLLWNGAKFDLLGRRFAITVHRRLPLMSSSFSLWEDGAQTPLLRVTVRQARAEALRLAQNVSLEGRRYAVLQGPLAARYGERVAVDRGRRFIVALRLLEEGRLQLAGSVPWNEKRPRPPTVALTPSADGKQLIVAPAAPTSPRSEVSR